MQPLYCSVIQLWFNIESTSWLYYHSMISQIHNLAINNLYYYFCNILLHLSLGTWLIFFWDFLVIESLLKLLHSALNNFIPS